MTRKLGVADALLCGSGSLALEIVLAHCGVAAGDEVVVPTFCCTAVVPPILNIGGAPVFADVGLELNMTVENFEAAATPKTRAVIVPHLFGNPAEIEAIRELAHAKDIRIIDDAAQALGATIDGRLVGSFGDAGILSFGLEKICSGIGGGVAVASRKNFFGEIHLPLASTAAAIKRFASTLFRRRWRRWTFPADKFSAAKLSPDEPPPAYPREGLSQLAASVALRLVQNLDENIALRRARVKIYRQLLERHERLRLMPHRPGSACLAQVVRIVPKNHDDDPATRVIETLRAAGYEVQGSYVPIHLLPPYERWTKRSLPNAEKIWGHLVELPCEPTVAVDDIERIAAIVKRTVV